MNARALALDYLNQLAEKIRKCPTADRQAVLRMRDIQNSDIKISTVVFVVPIPIVNCSPATPTATAAVFMMFVMFGVICMTHRTGYSELWRLAASSALFIRKVWLVIVEIRATNLH